MVELSVILIEMARLYKEALITASEREAEYNKDRADWTDKAKIGIKKREVIEKEEVEVAKEEKVEVIVVVEVKKEIKEIEVEEGEIEVGLIVLVEVMIIGKKILIQEEMTEIASKMKTMIEIMTEDIKKIIIQIEVMIALIQNLEDIKIIVTKKITIMMIIKEIIIMARIDFIMMMKMIITKEEANIEMEEEIIIKFIEII